MIKLINGYVIIPDKRQYKLMKESGKDKDGNIIYSSQITYHSTLQHALVAAFRLIGRNQIRKRDYTLKEVYLLMEDIEQRLMQVVVEGKSPEEFSFPDDDTFDDDNDD